MHARRFNFHLRCCSNLPLRPFTMRLSILLHARRRRQDTVLYLAFANYTSCSPNPTHTTPLSPTLLSQPTSNANHPPCSYSVEWKRAVSKTKTCKVSFASSATSPSPAPTMTKPSTIRLPNARSNRYRINSVPCALLQQEAYDSATHIKISTTASSRTSGHGYATNSRAGSEGSCTPS